MRKLGFTGSTEIGKVIMKSCAESNLKKASLELGGKSPLVIFADCDMDKAVRMVSWGWVGELKGLGRGETGGVEGIGEGGDGGS